MRFGDVVREVICALAPVYDELVLSHTVPDPIETHVGSFGSALFDGGVIGDTGSKRIVGLDGSGRLRMA